MDLFWKTGFAATSLDDLSSAMGMNRPSIFAAFGDKQALYREALDNYRAKSGAQMGEVLDPKRPLREALFDFYEAAIDIYLSGEDGARGCFMIGTALTEAGTNPEIRATLADSVRGLDKLLARRIALGQERGETKAGSDPVELARIACAMLYLLAIQARTGETRSGLRTTAAAALKAICAIAVSSRPARKSRT